VFVFGNYCVDGARSEGYTERLLADIGTVLHGLLQKNYETRQILSFLNFSNNKNKPDKTDKNYDQLWKLRIIFDKLNNSYAKYYSPTKHLAVDDIIVLFKGIVIFKEYIPKKHKHFGIKLYTLCDSKGYTPTYNMTVYLGKDRQHVTSSMTATHTTVTGLAARSGHVGHKLYMGNFFSSPASYDNLHTKTVHCYGTVRPNRQWITKYFEHRMKMKSGDLKTKVKGNLTATVWKN